MFARKIVWAGLTLALMLVLTVASLATAAAGVSYPDPKTAVGNLTGADTYDRTWVEAGGPECGTVTDTGSQGDQFNFHALPISVTAVETLEVEVIDAGTDISDSTLALYCNTFDPDQPDANLMAYDDDDGSDALSAFALSDGIILYPGRTYWLVISVYSLNDLGDGSYQIELLSETAVFGEAETPAPPASCDLESGFNVIHGTEGNDKITGTPGNDIIFGYGGNDRIAGMGGNDCLIGGPGNDQLFGDEGDDILWGGEVDNSTLYDSRDRDKLYGNDGNDELHGGGDKDRLDGNDGDDSMYGDDGDDTMVGHDGDDMMYGGAGRDNMRGDDGNDRMYGEAGNDRLYGRQGDDILDGGADTDQLDGSDGMDTCTTGEKLKSCELDEPVVPLDSN